MEAENLKPKQKNCKILDSQLIDRYNLPKNKFSPWDGDDQTNLPLRDKISYVVKIVPNKYNYNDPKKAPIRTYQYSLATGYKVTELIID